MLCKTLINAISKTEFFYFFYSILNFKWWLNIKLLHTWRLLWHCLLACVLHPPCHLQLQKYIKKTSWRAKQFCCWCLTGDTQDFYSSCWLKRLCFPLGQRRSLFTLQISFIVVKWIHNGESFASQNNINSSFLYKDLDLCLFRSTLGITLI